MGVLGASRECLEGVWKVSGRCLKGIWRVLCSCLPKSGKPGAFVSEASKIPTRARAPEILVVPKIVPNILEFQRS